MKPTEEIAREFLDETKGLPDSIKHKELVRLLNKVRREQDKITSHACANAIDDLDNTDVDSRLEAMEACMNVKAV
jgi:hypothetical protein